MIYQVTDRILDDFSAKDSARERGLALSRELVRICRRAGIAIHREEFNEASQLLDTSRICLEQLNSELSEHPDLYHGGFVYHAQQEFAECAVMHALLIENCEFDDIPSPEELNVEYPAYLNGLGDVGGELRRHILDLIRKGEPHDGEVYLDMMDSIYSILIQFDYPDVITYNLRRRTDVLRSLLERTRGDLTNAIQNYELERSMEGFESRLRSQFS
ncbi:MAG: haloacid dehalogenase [Methanosarcinaceae archaeon]|nr:haloacid dehalogenase [Methanosarcinaceae archaeon]